LRGETGRIIDHGIIGGREGDLGNIHRIAAAKVGVGGEVLVAHVGLHQPGDIEEVEVSITSLKGDPFFVDSLGEGINTGFGDEGAAGSGLGWIIELKDALFAGPQQKDWQE